MSYQVIPSDAIPQQPLQRFQEKSASRARLDNICLATVLVANLVAIAILVGGIYLMKAGNRAADNCFQKAGCFKPLGGNGGWECTKESHCGGNSSQVGGFWMQLIGGGLEFGGLIFSGVIIRWKFLANKLMRPENIKKVRESLFNSSIPLSLNNLSDLIDLGIFPKEFEQRLENLVLRHKALISRRNDLTQLQNGTLRQDLEEILIEDAALVRPNNKLAADWKKFLKDINPEILDIDANGHVVEIAEP